MGLTHEQIIPVKSTQPTFPLRRIFSTQWSALIPITFGTRPRIPGRKAAALRKSGGHLYICVPGMKKDCHDHLPKELLLSWTPEQLAYLRDITYWKGILSHCHDAEVISIYEMKGDNDELWADWINQENEIAVNDRKKSMPAVKIPQLYCF
jgi:hypothetical protein